MASPHSGTEKKEKFGFPLIFLIGMPVFFILKFTKISVKKMTKSWNRGKKQTHIFE